LDVDERGGAVQEVEEYLHGFMVKYNINLDLILINVAMLPILCTRFNFLIICIYIFC
jgi:hypothetical protein